MQYQSLLRYRSCNIYRNELWILRSVSCSWGFSDDGLSIVWFMPIDRFVIFFLLPSRSLSFSLLQALSGVLLYIKIAETWFTWYKFPGHRSRDKCWNADWQVCTYSASCYHCLSSDLTSRLQLACLVIGFYNWNLGS